MKDKPMKIVRLEAAVRGLKNGAYSTLDIVKLTMEYCYTYDKEHREAAEKIDKAGGFEYKIMKLSRIILPEDIMGTPF